MWRRAVISPASAADWIGSVFQRGAHSSTQLIRGSTRLTRLTRPTSGQQQQQQQQQQRHSFNLTKPYMYLFLISESNTQNERLGHNTVKSTTWVSERLTATAVAAFGRAARGASTRRAPKGSSSTASSSSQHKYPWVSWVFLFRTVVGTPGPESGKTQLTFGAL